MTPYQLLHDQSKNNSVVQKVLEIQFFLRQSLLIFKLKVGGSRARLYAVCGASCKRLTDVSMRQVPRCGGLSPLCILICQSEQREVRI